MICDELSQDEIFEAFLLYASLHGICEDVDEVRRRVLEYTENSVPDSTIDEAIVAYMDDEIVAPPDVVLAQWGSSRFYELAEHPSGDHRHRVCESWFESGCRLPEYHAPGLAHFWTFARRPEEAPPGVNFANRQLPAGTRLSLSVDRSLGWMAIHRKHGIVGVLPARLAESLGGLPLDRRRFIALVDDWTSPSQDEVGKVQRDGTVTDRLDMDRLDTARTGEDCGVATSDDAGICKIIVVTADESVTAERMIDYTTKVYYARRTKC